MAKKKRILLSISNNSGSSTLAMLKYQPDWIADKYLVSTANSLYTTRTRLGLLKYYWRFLFQDCVISTHSTRRFGFNQKKIELWHGLPIKTVGLMDLGLPRQKRLKLSTEMQKRIDYFITTSGFQALIMNACFGICAETYKTLGSPRNDFLFRPDGRQLMETVLKQPLADKKVLFYMPTFRMLDPSRIEGQVNVETIFGFDSLDLAAFSRFLRDENILLVLKFHPWEEKYITDRMKNLPADIVFLSDAMLAAQQIDLYEILGAADLLITDYSSVYYDFLLLDKPMLFTPADIGMYRQNRGLLLEPYEKWIPGPAVADQFTLQQQLHELLVNPEYYQAERQKLKETVHVYQDNQSSRRVWKFIDELLS